MFGHSHSPADREKSSVALSSALAAVALTGTKLAVGLWTNSLGILSEAAHSGLDLVAAIVTYLTVRISGKPADREHAYGHAKLENLSALLETLLLLLTSVWIVWEASERLFYREAHVAANIWSFVVVIISIAIDASRSRALKRVADKHQSQALEADALHFSTDIWSSCVVLLGLAGVVAARKSGVPWLAKADALAALGVALIVIGVCYRLGKKAIEDLLDTTPEELRTQIAKAAFVDGVHQVRQVRVRRSGPEIFADVILTVRHSVPFEKAHEIADRSEEAIRAALPKADVVVHVEPFVPDGEDPLTTARTLAARRGMAAHSMRIYEERGGRSLDIHLEVDAALKLEEAHLLASEFEADLRRAIPSLVAVVTHIEPAGADAAMRRARPVCSERIQEAISKFIKTRKMNVQPHDVTVRMASGELDVSLHCALDAATGIQDAHNITVQLEQYLRKHVPGLGRVVIHVEPKDEGRP